MYQLSSGRDLNFPNCVPLTLSTMSFRPQYTQGHNSAAENGAIMLLAVVFTNYCFQVNDVGASGKETNAATL